MYGVHLSGLPPSGKLFCTLFLIGIGCGAVAAFAQAATAIGLTPSDVQASLAPEMPMTHMGHGPSSAEKEISLGDISKTARVGVRTKMLFVALPFVGTLVDIAGMWLARFVWPSFGVLVIAGGTLFALGYV